jgi:histidine ammonia-lyase
MGSIAAKMTRTALPLVWKILAIETLALVQAADLRGKDFVFGSDFRKLHGIVRSVSAQLGSDRPLMTDIEEVTRLLQSEDVQQQCLAPQLASHDEH